MRLETFNATLLGFALLAAFALLLVVLVAAALAIRAMAEGWHTLAHWARQREARRLGIDPVRRLGGGQP